MKPLISLSTVKTVGLGFLFGFLGSWLLASSTVFLHPGPIVMVLQEHEHKNSSNDISFHNHAGHHEEERLLVDQWAKSIPLMAFIFTSQKEKAGRAVPIKNTWASRFNQHVFFSDRADTDLPSVALTKTKGWPRTREAIAHLYWHFLDQFNFFMKAQDDNFVIVENLRALVHDRDSKVPVIMGRQMQEPKEGVRYLSDEAGYVMTRAALEKLGEGLKKNVEACQDKDVDADIGLAKCATAVGVNLIHAKDSNQADYFHPAYPSDMLDSLVKKRNPNVANFEPSQMISGLSCCSDLSVTFGGATGASLFQLEYMTYHLYPYGIIQDPENYERMLVLRNAQGTK